jgi:hypothetical protein
MFKFMVSWVAVAAIYPLHWTPIKSYALADRNNTHKLWRNMLDFG